MRDDIELSWRLIERYREGTFRFDPRRRLRSEDEAIRFVKERGFIFFWPITGFEFPSLWGAVAGNRPVPDQHDDPAHVTWRWKDNLLGKGIWYYAKVLRQKSTIISLDLLPSFYALSPNFGEPEQDYLLAYQDGTLSLEEKLVYEAILEHGPLDSIMLRAQSRLSSKENTSRFNRALNLLMRDFRILPVGVAEAGTWNYAFFTMPSIGTSRFTSKARLIGESSARSNILKHISCRLELNKHQRLRNYYNGLFSYRKSLDSLIQSDFVVNQVKFTGKVEDWWMLTSLLN